MAGMKVKALAAKKIQFDLCLSLSLSFSLSLSLSFSLFVVSFLPVWQDWGEISPEAGF
jgi:hypothetical protein